MGYRNSILNAEGFRNWMIEKNHKTVPFILTTEDIQEVLNNQAIVDRWENAIQIVMMGLRWMPITSNLTTPPHFQS